MKWYILNVNLLILLRHQYSTHIFIICFYVILELLYRQYKNCELQPLNLVLFIYLTSGETGRHDWLKPVCAMLHFLSFHGGGHPKESLRHLCVTLVRDVPFHGHPFKNLVCSLETETTCRRPKYWRISDPLYLR